MHKANEYTYNKYLRIKFRRHNFILTLTVFVLYIMQLVTLLNYNDISLSNLPIEVLQIAIMMVFVCIAYYIYRFRFDYVFYKYIFAKHSKLRLIYNNNLIIGPLLVYLTIYFFGVFGMIILWSLSLPGKDYFNFRSDVEALNHNYYMLQKMVEELVANPQVEEYDETVGYIKYNISMYNLYEIALFENEAVSIEFDQLIKEAIDKQQISK